jgi:hypothetical protein
MITACEVRAVSEAALIAALRTEPKPGERMVLVGMPMGLVIEPQPPLPPRPAKPTVPVRPPAPRQPRAGGSREVLYQLRGMVDVAPTAKDAFLTILRTLAAKDGTFWAHLAPLVVGRNVNHIARSPAEVHPHRPTFVARPPRSRGDGSPTRTSRTSRRMRILRAACEAAGIVFGRDLRIELPNA